MQGDIINLYKWNDSSTGAHTASKIAAYEYDAWGKLNYVTASNGGIITDPTSPALLNPIRYRGYYYDTESGFYYLQSRYYDPVISRFINADSFASTGTGFLGYNMYAYCNNNPIVFKDDGGCRMMCATADPDVCGGNYEKPAFNVAGKISSAHNANRRPNEGDPGSTYKAPNGDWRQFGDNRKPSLDYDHDDHGQPDKHPHDENGGHYHDWDWSKNPPRQPARVNGWDALEGLGKILLFGSGALLLIGDDLTGFGVADNVYIDSFWMGIQEGAATIWSWIWG